MKFFEHLKNEEQKYNILKVRFKNANKKIPIDSVDNKNISNNILKLHLQKRPALVLVLGSTGPGGSENGPFWNQTGLYVQQFSRRKTEPPSGELAGVGGRGLHGQQA